MGKIITITSGKGGVGKTTISTNIAAFLTALNKKVLLIDMDLGLRNLDIFLGLENACLFDITDLISKRCKLSDVLISHPGINNLFFIPASQTSSPLDVDSDNMSATLKSLSNDFDYIIIDSPAGIGSGFHLASSSCDMAIIIATPDLPSIRDADRAAGILHAKGVKQLRLIVNRVKPKLIKKGFAPTIDEIIDQTSVRLIGILPDSDLITTYQNKGLTLLNSKSIISKCFNNIANRINGNNLPLQKLK